MANANLKMKLFKLIKPAYNWDGGEEGQQVFTMKEKKTFIFINQESSDLFCFFKPCQERKKGHGLRNWGTKEF